MNATTQAASAVKVPPAFARYGTMIREALRNKVRAGGSELNATHRYYMGWQDAHGAEIDGAEGKRLRPTLALLAAEASGGNASAALPIAVALEYVHNFSLIHDDLEDEDRYRHHRPTVWVVWGRAKAILSGNAMLKVADAAATELTDIGLDQRSALAIQGKLVAAYLTMMEGQFLDLWFEDRRQVSLAEYFDMIERKTGALIASSMELGSLAAVAEADTRDAPPMHLADVGMMHELGRTFGAIFQVRDDVLGVWGGSSTGKPVGGDILRRKKSLPAVHAMGAASGAAKSRLDEVYASADASPPDIEDVLGIMEETGSRGYCESVCESRWATGREILRHLDAPDRFVRDLTEIGDYLLERES